MSDRVQDLTNHRKVAVACKNYTDTEIKKSEERILSIVARNNVDFIDHMNEPTYRFTAPANSKLLMLQSIGGNSVKYSPSVASDSTTAYQKAIPSYSPSIDRASASMNILGGMSYKVNQLVTNADFVKNSNGITITNVNHKMTITGTSTASETFNIWLSSDVLGLKINHKYLFVPTNNNNDRLRFLGQTYTSDNMFIVNKITSNNGIFTDTTNDNYKFQIYFSCRVGITYNDEYYLQLFDLTSDFGSGNEPTSVSDCATEYAKRGINIYEYTPKISDIRDTAPTSVKSVGFNIWNEQKELGGYDQNTGAKTSSSITYRNVNPIAVRPNTEYYIKKKNGDAGFVYYYDSNMNYISASYKNTSTTFTTPSNCYFINFTSMASTWENETCINISNVSLNGTYKPYFSDTLAIDSNIQALDGYGWGVNDTCYNYVDFNAKKFEKIVNKSKPTQTIVDNVSLNSSYTTTLGVNVYKFNKFSDYKGYGTWTNGAVICDKYEISNYNSSITTPYIFVNASQTEFNIVLPNKTLEEAKTIIADITFYYELATPVETDISAYLDGNEIEIEPQGTLSFESTYNAYVPSNVSYNGVIKHALATAVKQDGFNKWDEETELGAIDTSTGQNAYASTMLRSKNYIQVIPDETYYLKSPSVLSIRYYDSNKNYLGAYDKNGNGDGNNTTRVMPSNCCYIRFVIANTYGTTYNNDICINISNQDLNGTYKPHKATITRLLPNSEAKYSWGITDGVRNTRVFCDDEGNAVNEGSLVVGNNDLGLQTWGKTSVFYTTLNDMKLLAQTICNNFETYIMEETLPNYDCIQIRNNHYIYFRYQNDSPYASLEANVFKSSMNGVMLEFEKATTDTETLDDFDYFFDCEEGDTFTLVNTEQLQCYATYSFLIKEAKSNE